MASSIPHTKVYSRVQNGLTASLNSKNTSVLKEVFDCKISETTKLCVEGAIRDFVLRKICTGGAVDLEKIKILVQICIEGARNELCLVTLPILLLSDIFDCITISQCEELFTFVEENVSVFKEDMFFTSCKNQVLRMCNDVLRRLSRSQNTIFCGRILLFLARFFPFSERSGLNLISEFNFENVTMFTDGETNGMEVDEVTETDVKAEVKPSLDYTLYTKFWSLQDFFRNPVQCHQKGSWKLFTKYAEDILEAFSSFKLQGTQNDYPKSAKEMSDQINSIITQEEDYFPKYLTNQKLLDLQFSDSNFRRYILVQMLILGQYLTTNIKFKQEALTNDQYLWVRKMAEKSYLLLSETPPNGSVFVEIVKHILKREDMWNDWKNNGCPEIKKPGKSMKRAIDSTLKSSDDITIVKPVEIAPKKQKLGYMIRDADKENRVIMGNDEMTRLWNICNNNLQACKQEERDFVPSLENYFISSFGEVMREGSVKDKDKLVNNSNFGWRGLRLLACKSPHFFTHSTQSISTLPDYLKTMIRKLAKDLNLQFDEPKPEEDDEVKVLLDQSENNKETVAEQEEDDQTEREEMRPITEDERKALASVLAKDEEKMKTLAKKLGFEPDEIDYFLSESKSIEEAIVSMLDRWVEDEKDEANKENIIYILGGLKMEDIAKKAFPEAEIDENKKT